MNIRRCLCSFLGVIINCPAQHDNEDSSDGGDEAPNRKLELEKLGGAELHKQLMEVDPKMAAMLHPNNKRKIARWYSW